MMKATRKQVLKSLGALLLSSLCYLLAAAPVQAVASHQWHLTGESIDGLAQQYVDLKSIRGRGNPELHQWIVESYFTERKANEVVRADYVTLYDCDRHRYKDVNSDGIPALDWGNAAGDPLNLETMEYVCQHLPNVASP